VNTYQYILDGAIDKDGDILIGFRISQTAGYAKKFEEVIKHCIDKGCSTILIEISKEWAHERKRVLVTGKK